MYGYSNPLSMPYQMPVQRQEIVRVNGEGGARAYQMYPNSSALLLDENNPIVWLVQTDGAGYKSVSAYEITPHKSETVNPSDYSDLEARIKRLEDKINESYSKCNDSQQTPNK